MKVSGSIFANLLVALPENIYGENFSFFFLLLVFFLFVSFCFWFDFLLCFDL